MIERRAMKGRLAELEADEKRLARVLRRNCEQIGAMLNPLLHDLADMPVPDAAALMDEAVLQQAELLRARGQIDELVFPTCVGVFPCFSRCSPFTRSLPHVRGGVSVLILCDLLCGGSSPRAWGCFYAVQPEGRDQGVFPTCVGVFPRPKASRSR